VRQKKIKGTPSETRLEVVIGKDILELLSSSMYVEPLTIYREYVQNAADAIDEAVAARLLADRSEGRIEISLDHIGRRVQIRDNGIGVSKLDFKLLLTAFGASHKRGTSARGFRGVGRLAGLGYCQELVFRSRTNSGEPVQELRWNCSILKKQLADSSFLGSLEKIVSQIVSFSELTLGDYPERFFEVEIIKPRRIGNDVLLNEKIIEQYLGQVAPVPFSPNFRFASDIKQGLISLGHTFSEYNICLNDSESPICRPFRDSVPYSETNSGEGREIQIFDIQAIDGELAAYGWLLHHDYQGAIPSGLGVRGLRARVGNLQIGGERNFSDIFPEERFNSWTIGEVHVVDRRIAPNGRRDDFEYNSHFANLINHLTPYAGNIARHCRSSSQIRNRVKTFELGAEKIQEALAVLEQGAISERKTKELKMEIGLKLHEIENAAGFDLLNDGVRKELTHQLKELERRTSSVSNDAEDDDPLKNIPPRKRAIYTEIIDLIYDCAVNQVAAKSLIDRILSKINHA
jgi:hypothetical protein